MAIAKKALEAKYETFVFWIRRPSLTYRFALQHQKWIDDPYYESHSLTLIAQCLYPERFKDWEAAVLFFASDQLSAGDASRVKRPEEPIKAVGSVMYGKSRLDVSGFLPTAMIWRLGSAIHQGLITSMSVNGRRVNRGHIHANSLGFHGPDYDPIEDFG